VRVFAVNPAFPLSLLHPIVVSVRRVPTSSSRSCGLSLPAARTIKSRTAYYILLLFDYATGLNEGVAKKEEG
jgi:hypothetical protein